ncbi:meiotic cell cortex C-terminal pleckstrin homology-domain-containing protein, partial [Limtongia smithiae]|uniref:meiotic cell cortex C-terminal pleckstrin homology-domain-containing protein n=1 Tax=Limtongia smithiae TaxID=1125753 RepID=UPI0034CD9808
ELQRGYQDIAYESSRLFNSRGASTTPISISGKENAPLLSARTSGTTTRKQRNSATRPQDLQFVTDIGQELLVECRRLQMLATEKDDKLKEADAARSTLVITIENLEARVRQLDESEEKYKEENWNLEMRIQQLESDSAVGSDRLSKINLENSKTLQLYTAQLETIEALQQREHDLAEQLESWQAKYDTDMANYEQTISLLNKQNDGLTASVDVLSTQLTELQSSSPDHDDGNNIPETGLVQSGDEFSDEPKTPERSPPISPVKMTPAHHAGLEGQTLNASLAHAHRTITTLRNSMFREKAEKAELRRLLAESQEEMDAMRLARGPKKTKNSLGSDRGTSAQPIRRTLLGAGGRRSQYRLSADLDDPERDMNWETFNGTDSDNFVSAAESLSGDDTESFETANDYPTSGDDDGTQTETEAYHTGLESVHEVLDHDTETGSDIGMRGLNSNTSVRSVDSMTDDDDDVMGSSRIRAQLFKKSNLFSRNSGNFNTPQPLYNELGDGSSDDSVTPSKPASLPLSTAEELSRLPTVESVTADAAALDMIVLSQDDYNNLINREITQDGVLESVQADAASLNMVAVPKEEHDTLLEKANAMPTPESVKADAAGLAMVALPKEEHDTLMEKANASPTVESVAADAEELSLYAVSKDEYESLLAKANAVPTVESVTAAAALLSLVAVSKDDYEQLTNKAIEAETPATAESVAMSAAALSLVTVPKDDYNVLVDKASAKRTAVDVATDAAAFSLVAIPETEYASLKAESEKVTTAEGVAAAAAALSLTAVPKTYFETPSQSLTLVPDTTDKAIVSPEISSKTTPPSRPSAAEPSPFVYHCVSQCMVGDYVWKYTRRAGRQTLSENRHKRFFSLNPYSRTITWGRHPASAAGGSESRARSAQIESVEVVYDDNPFPPGLYHRSIIVHTASRIVKFTCLTGDVHERWVTALSFLLVHRNAVEPTAESDPGKENRGAAPPVRPTTAVPRTALGTSQYVNTAGATSRRSTTSSHSTTRSMSYSTLNQSVAQNASFRLGSRGSMGRLTSFLRPPTGSFQSPEPPLPVRIDANGVYEAQRARNSMEELRTQILREEENAERLENVRACCDGEYLLLRLSMIGLTCDRKT